MGRGAHVAGARSDRRDGRGAGADRVAHYANHRRGAPARGGGGGLGGLEDSSANKPTGHTGASLGTDPLVPRMDGSSPRLTVYVVLSTALFSSFMIEIVDVTARCAS